MLPWELTSEIAPHHAWPWRLLPASARALLRAAAQIPGTSRAPLSCERQVLVGGGGEGSKSLQLRIPTNRTCEKFWVVVIKLDVPKFRLVSGLHEAASVYAPETVAVWLWLPPGGWSSMDDDKDPTLALSGKTGSQYFGGPIQLAPRSLETPICEKKQAAIPSEPAMLTSRSCFETRACGATCGLV